METTTTGRQNMEKFRSHFTKAINDNRSDTGTLKAIGIANTVKEQVDQNKENQRILAQAKQMIRSIYLKNKQHTCMLLQQQSKH